MIISNRETTLNLLETSTYISNDNNTLYIPIDEDRNIDFYNIKSICEEYSCTLDSIKDIIDSKSNEYKVIFDESDILLNPNLVDIFPNYVIRPVSESNIVSRYTEYLIDRYVDTLDESYMEYIYEPYKILDEEANNEKAIELSMWKDLAFYLAFDYDHIKKQEFDDKVKDGKFDIPKFQEKRKEVVDFLNDFSKNGNEEDLKKVKDIFNYIKDKDENLSRRNADRMNIHIPSYGSEKGAKVTTFKDYRTVKRVLKDMNIDLNNEEIKRELDYIPKRIKSSDYKKDKNGNYILKDNGKKKREPRIDLIKLQSYAGSIKNFKIGDKYADVISELMEKHKKGINKQKSIKNLINKFIKDADSYNEINDTDYYKECRKELEENLNKSIKKYNDMFPNDKIELYSYKKEEMNDENTDNVSTTNNDTSTATSTSTDTKQEQPKSTHEPKKILPKYMTYKEGDLNDPSDPSFLTKVKRAVLNKPRDFIAKMAAKLRSLYRVWLSRAKRERNANKASFFKKIAIKILSAVDWLLKKITKVRSKGYGQSIGDKYYGYRGRLQKYNTFKK